MVFLKNVDRFSKLYQGESYRNNYLTKFNVKRFNLLYFHSSAFALNTKEIFFLTYVLLLFSFLVKLLFDDKLFDDQNNANSLMIRKRSIAKGSRSQMFVKIGVLKNSAIFTGKHLC